MICKLNKIYLPVNKWTKWSGKQKKWPVITCHRLLYPALDFTMNFGGNIPTAIDNLDFSKSAVLERRSRIKFQIFSMGAGWDRQTESMEILSMWEDIIIHMICIRFSDTDSYVFLFAPTYQYKTLSLYVLKHLFRKIVKLKHFFLADNYLFKVDDRSTRTRCEICPKS